MCLAITYTVMCDQCAYWTGQEYTTAREARQKAKRAGFVRIPGDKNRGKHNGGRDLCRRCAPQEEIITTESHGGETFTR